MVVGNHFDPDDKLKTTMDISKRLVDLDITRIILSIATRINVNNLCYNLKRNI